MPHLADEEAEPRELIIKARYHAKQSASNVIFLLM